MSDSLRDQLLGLGYKPAPVKPKRPGPGNTGGRNKPAHKAQPHRGQPARQATRAEEMDLGKAYAIRAQKEKQERIDAERAKQEQARQRREARVRLAELVAGKALNDDGAEIARHFDYGGKIKRIHVTAAQLKALNAGQLGVLQLNGRYLLVGAGLLAQAEAVFPEAVALKVDPHAPATDDAYVDPCFQVPDDLVW